MLAGNGPFYSLGEHRNGEATLPGVSPSSTEQTDERRPLGDARTRRSLGESPAPTSTSSSSAPGSRGSARPAIWSASGRGRVSSSLKRATRSGAPGTCSAIPAYARIRTCRRSATPFARGTTRRRSPTVRQFLRYLAETAREYGVDRAIRFGHKVVQRFLAIGGRALDAGRERSGRGDSAVLVQFSFLCAGYYEYAEGYMPAGRAWRDSPAASFIRSSGPKTCATKASAWSSSAAERPQSRSSRRWRRRRRTSSCCNDRRPTSSLARPRRRSAKRLQTMASGSAHPRHRALEEHVLADLPFRLSRRKPAAVRAEILKLAQAASRTGDRRRQALQPSLRAVGPAPVPRPGRRPVRGAARRARRRWSPARSKPSPRPALRLTSGEELAADIIVTATGLKMRADGRDQRSRSTASRSKWRARRSIRARCSATSRIWLRFSAIRTHPGPSNPT